MEENKSVYALKKVNKPQSFCAEIKNIKGVLDATVDEENMTLEYSIDDWTSEYDVFTQIMTIAEAYGCEFDYDRDLSGGAKTEEDEQPAVELPEEEEIEEDEEESENDSEDEKPKKKRKGLSERVQRIIELSVALVFFIAALFFKDTVQLIILAVAFAVAGYDVLYEALLKIIKKNFINEELLLSLAFFGSIFLGKPVEGVAAVLLYSVAAFALKTAKELIDEKSPVYYMPEKCRKALDGNKAIKTPVGEIVVGDTVYFKKGEHCLFDGSVNSAAEVLSYDGEKRTLKQGEAVYAGERFAAAAFVTVEKVAGEGRFDKRNERAKAVIGSKSRLQAFVAKKSKIYLPIALAVCLLLAFLPPIAFDSYTDGLMRWGYTAVILAALCSTFLTCGSHAIALFAGVVAAKKKGVMPADYETAERLVATNEIYVDRESVMLENGEVKGDCRGAAMELWDFGKRFVMVSSRLKSECEKECEELRIPDYYGEKNDGQKTDVFDKALKSGKTIVASEKMIKKCGLTAEQGVIMAYSDEDSDYSAGVTVTDTTLARIPFTAKLAARTIKICKVTSIVGLSVKGLLAVLALCGVAGLWWVVLADTLVGVGACVAAVLNSKEVL